MTQRRAARLSAATLVSITFWLVALEARAEVGVNGAFETTVPIAVPAFHGLEPQVALSYSSSAANGWVGVGWAVSGLSTIARTSKTDGSPSWDGKDRFRIDGVRLIRCDASTPETRPRSPSCAHRLSWLTAYATRIESFARVAFETNASGGRWYAWQPDGRKTTYEPGVITAKGVYDWRITRVEDAAGVNVVTYEWAQPPRAPPPQPWPVRIDPPVLRAIRYGNVEIRFHSTPRTDSLAFATGGEIAQSAQRLQAVEVKVDGRPLRTYALRFDEPGEIAGQAFLREVQQYGRDAEVGPTGAVTGRTAAPARTFRRAASAPRELWQARPPIEADGWSAEWPARGDLSRRRSTLDEPGALAPIRSWVTADVSSDGRADSVLVANQVLRALVSRPEGGFSPRETKTGWPRAETSPGDYGEPYQQFLSDADGDGDPDVLQVIARPGGSRELGVAISTRDGAFAPRPVVTLPQGFQEWQVGDTNNDGISDLVGIIRGRACELGCGCPMQAITATAVFRVGLGRADGTWEFMPEVRPCWTLNGGNSVGTLDPNIGVLDLNGDLRADVVAFEPPGTPTGGTADPPARVKSAIADGAGGFVFSDVAIEGPDWGPIKYSRDPRRPARGVWGDVNGDHRTDLVVLHHGPFPSTQPQADRLWASTLFGRGDGTFRAPIDRPTSVSDDLLVEGDLEHAASQAVFVPGDFDGNGATDLAAISPVEQWPGPLQVQRMLSNRAGAWKAQKPVSAVKYWSPDWHGPCTPVDCREPGFTSQSGDQDGDGRDDLVFAQHVAITRYPKGWPNCRPCIPAGDRLGVGIEAVLSPAGPSARSLNVGDVTGDGRPDLTAAAATWDPDASASKIVVRVLRRQAGRSFAEVESSPEIELAGGPIRESSWMLLEADGDRRADLVLLDQDRVVSLLARADAQWERVVTPMPGVAGAGWQAGDVTGDERADLVRVRASATGRSAVVETLSANADGSWERERRDVGLRPVDSLAWRFADVDGDARSDLVHVAPAGRAGAVHTLLRRDGGWQAVDTQPWLRAPEPPDRPLLPDHLVARPAGSDSLGWRALDLNADGNIDLAHVSLAPDGRIYVSQLLSAGDGTWLPEGGFTGAAAQRGAVTAADTQNFLPADIDRDGHADLIRAVVQRGGRVTVETLLARGDGRWWHANAPAVDDPSPRGADTSSWQTVDLDANGDTDLAQIADEKGTLSVRQINSSVPRAVVGTIDNGVGTTTRLSYRLSTDPLDVGSRHCRLPPGLVASVVDAITIEDQPSRISEQRAIRLQCPRWSSQLRTLLAWRDITTTTEAAVNRPRTRLHVHRAVFDEGIVQPTRTEVIESDGATETTLERTDQAYAPIGQAPFIDAPQREEHAICSRERCALTTTTFEFDDDGNLTHKEIADAGAEHRLITESSYARAREPYILSAINSEELRDEGGRVLSRSLTCLDEDRSDRCDARPTRALPTRIRRWDGTAERWTETTMRYDHWGNLVEVVDPRGHATLTTFDEKTHLRPIRVCNALGHCTARTFDPISGEVKSLIDPNGSRSEFDYDDLGRETQERHASGLVITSTFEHDPTRGRLRSETTTVPGGTSFRISTRTDGLDRTYRLIREDLGGEHSIAYETRYSDASAHPYRHSRPRSDGSDTRWQTLIYDGLGRVVLTRHADGAEIARSYGVTGADDRAGPSLVAVTTTDESGRRHTEYLDHLRNHTAVLERSGRDGEAALTRYRRDALGHVTAVTDPHGNTTRTIWDTLGQVIEESDADRGSTSYAYDASGNLTRRTDARGRTTTLDYDAVDRLTTKRDATGETARWFYDEPGHGASVGRLTSVRDRSAIGCPGRRSRSLTYDPSGRPTGETRCVSATQATFETDFDAFGHPTAIKYPDGERVAYTYDFAGRVTSVPGYAKRLSYDAAGNLISAEYPNGTQAQAAFSADRGWPVSQRLTNVSGRVLFDTRTRFGPNGLLAASSSTTNRMNSSFHYDENRRLTRVVGDWPQQLAYDAIGNITANSRLGAYTYGRGAHQCSRLRRTTPCGGVHAVVRAGRTRYHYDTVGQLTQSTRSGKLLRRFVWDRDGLPTLIRTRGRLTTISYNADGDRVETRSAGRVTKYFGARADWSPSRGFAKHVYAGTILLATHRGRDKTWYTLDRLGSPRLITDAAGRALKRNDFAAFGEAARNASSIGFAGQPNDGSTGLVYMRSRYYDPTLGRMLSADSLVPDPANPQAYNRYSYVYNDPVNYTDPTGHEPEGGSAPGSPSWFSQISAYFTGDAEDESFALDEQSRPESDVTDTEHAQAEQHWENQPLLVRPENEGGGDEDSEAWLRANGYTEEANLVAGGLSETIEVTPEYDARTVALARSMFNGPPRPTTDLDRLAIAIAAVPAMVAGGAIATAAAPVIHIASIRLYLTAPKLFDTGIAIGTAVTGTPKLKPTGPIHHIATDKHTREWTPAFEEIFERAGMTLDDDANLVPLPGHIGSHAYEYHMYVWVRLNAVTEGLTRAGAAAALKTELGFLRQELLNNVSLVGPGGWGR